MSDGEGVWLYAITRDLPGGALSGARGVGGEPVRTVEAAGMVAVVGSVRLDDFGEAALRRNLEDLDWLARTARAHDTVVDVVAHAGPVMPSRLATVYLADARVRELLQDRGRDLEAALDRLTGRTEWGVKAYADPEARTGPVAEQSTTQAGQGTAYLLRRRAERSAKESARQQAAADADAVHSSLSGLSVGARRHPPQDAQLAGTKDWMVLNGTYLVEHTRGEEFATAVSTLDRERAGLRLELTGPWPPYSFAACENSVDG
jgi:hypothetical protein